MRYEVVSTHRFCLLKHERLIFIIFFKLEDIIIIYTKYMCTVRDVTKEKEISFN